MKLRIIALSLLLVSVAAKAAENVEVRNTRKKCLLNNQETTYLYDDVITISGSIGYVDFDHEKALFFPYQNVNLTRDGEVQVIFQNQSHSVVVSGIKSIFNNYDFYIYENGKLLTIYEQVISYQECNS